MVFFPGSPYFVGAVLPKTGLESGAETCLPYGQRSCGYIAHRPQITYRHGLHMTHCIPTAFLQKKVLPVPCPQFVLFLVPTETHNCAFLLGCILFHPDRLLSLPSPFSELQPRLPLCLQALVA